MTNEGSSKVETLIQVAMIRLLLARLGRSH